MIKKNWRRISQLCRLQPGRFMVLAAFLVSPLMGWFNGATQAVVPPPHPTPVATRSAPFRPTPWPTSTLWATTESGSQPQAPPAMRDRASTIKPDSFVVRQMPTITPKPLSSSQKTTIEIVVYEDRNGNEQVDPLEGVAQLSVQALAGGEIIGWGLTDPNGRIVFVLNESADTLAIPYLGWHQTIWGTAEIIAVRLISEGEE